MAGGTTPAVAQGCGRVAREALSMDLLMTGANGFLGAQVATQWLLRHPAARIGCLVRGADDAAAQARLHAALRRAMADQGLDADPDAVLARAEAIRGDMADPGWTARAQAWLRGPAELFHCAANLSFREADREAVWRTNVDGTRALLEALPVMPELTAFNYVSTAYVAGDRQGEILEDDHARPDRFNNPYEESKWTAEALVREACGATGLAWRVFRPSIIIAHSATHRMASQSGFYQVADALWRFGQSPRARTVGEVLLPVTPGTTLDLIPVDIVVREMLALMALGDASADRTFHITSEAPLSLGEVLRELSPMSGVSIGVMPPIGIGTGATADAASAVAALVMRQLRFYMPYFSFARRFDRRNAAMGGEATSFRLDVGQLRGFVVSFMEREDREGGLTMR